VRKFIKILNLEYFTISKNECSLENERRVSQSVNHLIITACRPKITIQYPVGIRGQKLIL